MNKTRVTNLPNNIGVRVRTNKSTICNSQELEAMEQTVKATLPEMVFGGSYIEVDIKDTTKDQSVWITVLKFKAEDALSLVRTGPDSHAGVEVLAAKYWKGRGGGSLMLPYDWTYSSNYRGTINLNSTTTLERNPTNATIDVALLQRPDPILFWDEVVLFEDELGDNGAAILTARVRVMPNCFFILLRLFIRIDGVLFRSMDTRIFHKFGTSTIIREFSRRECPYDTIKAALISTKPAPTSKNTINERANMPTSTENAAKAHQSAILAQNKEIVEKRSSGIVSPITSRLPGTRNLRPTLSSSRSSLTETTINLDKAEMLSKKGNAESLKPCTNRSTSSEDLSKLNDVDWVVSIMAKEGPKEPKYINSIFIEDVIISDSEKKINEISIENLQFTSSSVVVSNSSEFCISKDIIDIGCVSSV